MQYWQIFSSFLIFSYYFMNLLNYVPFVLSHLACLVPYVLLCLTFLAPYVLSCLKCLLPYLFLCSTCIVHKYSRVLRASCSTYFRALRAVCVTHLVYYVPRAKRAVVFRVFCVLLFLTCLVPCVFSGCSCLELYVLLCFLPLTSFRCFKPNMLLCISSLVAFMPCASCTFVTLATWVFTDWAKVNHCDR